MNSSIYYPTCEINVEKKLRHTLDVDLSKVAFISTSFNNTKMMGKSGARLKQYKKYSTWYELYGSYIHIETSIRAWQCPLEYPRINDGRFLWRTIIVGRIIQHDNM